MRGPGSAVLVSALLRRWLEVQTIFKVSLGKLTVIL